MKKIFFLILALIINQFVLFSQDFEVSPVLMYFTAEQGTSQTIKLTVTNHSNQKSTFTITSGDFDINEKGEKVYKDAGISKHSISPWVSFNPGLFELNPNSKQEISVVIQIPAEDVSTKWGVLNVKATREQGALNADKSLRTGLIMSPMISINLFQSPQSNTNYKGKISNLLDITTKEDTVYRFSADVLNIGDKILNCKIYLIVANISTAEEIKFEAINFNSFPETNCTINLKMPKTLAKGNYVVAAIMDFGNNTTLEGAQTLLEVK